MKKTEVDVDITTVSLDHIQRLNLVMLIGAMEATVGEMRALWQLQDKLDLTADEKDSIGFFTRAVNGTEVQGWDVTKSLPLKSYDLSEADIQRIKKALEQYPRHRVQIARPWLEPLSAQIPEILEARNGSR